MPRGRSSGQAAARQPRVDGPRREQDEAPRPPPENARVQEQAIAYHYRTELKEALKHISDTVRLTEDRLLAPIYAAFEEYLRKHPLLRDPALAPHLIRQLNMGLDFKGLDWEQVEQIIAGEDPLEKFWQACEATSLGPRYNRNADRQTLCCLQVNTRSDFDSFLRRFNTYISTHKLCLGPLQEYNIPDKEDRRDLFAILYKALRESEHNDLRGICAQISPQAINRPGAKTLAASLTGISNILDMAPEGTQPLLTADILTRTVAELQTNIVAMLAQVQGVKRKRESSMSQASPSVAPSYGDSDATAQSFPSPHRPTSRQANGSIPSSRRNLKLKYPCYKCSTKGQEADHGYWDCVKLCEFCRRIKGHIPRDHEQTDCPVRAKLLERVSPPTLRAFANNPVGLPREVKDAVNEIISRFNLNPRRNLDFLVNFLRVRAADLYTSEESKMVAAIDKLRQSIDN